MTYLEKGSKPHLHALDRGRTRRDEENEVDTWHTHHVYVTNAMAELDIWNKVVQEVRFEVLY